MTKASSKKPAKTIKKPAAKAAASKSVHAKKSLKPAPVKGKPVKAAAKAPARPVAKTKPVKVLTKAQLAAQAKDEKLKAKAALKPGKLDPKAAAPLVMPLKPGSKIAAKKPGENEAPGDADSPLLDMSDVGVRKMIAKAKTRGYVT